VSIRASNYFEPQITLCEAHPDDPGCDTTRPLEASHPSGPGLEGPMPDPGDEKAWAHRDTHDGRMPLDEET
jgi:hypothetical protein